MSITRSRTSSLSSISKLKRSFSSSTANSYGGENPLAGLKLKRKSIFSRDMVVDERKVPVTAGQEKLLKDKVGLTLGDMTSKGRVIQFEDKKLKKIQHWFKPSELAVEADPKTAAYFKPKLFKTKIDPSAEFKAKEHKYTRDLEIVGDMKAMKYCLNNQDKFQNENQEAPKVVNKMRMKYKVPLIVGTTTAIAAAAGATAGVAATVPVVGAAFTGTVAGGFVTAGNTIAATATASAAATAGFGAGAGAAATLAAGGGLLGIRHLYRQSRARKDNQEALYPGIHSTKHMEKVAPSKNF